MVDIARTRAKIFFESLKLKCEEEPAWIKSGRRPDLYCSGLHEFWAEIKTIEETSEFLNAYQILERLQLRSKHIKRKSQAFAYITEGEVDGSIRFIVKVLENTLKYHNFLKHPILLLVDNFDGIPQDIFEFFYITNKKLVRAVCRGNADKMKFSVPTGHEPDPWSQIVEIRSIDGTITQRPAREVIKYDNQYTIALSVENWEKEFIILGSMPSGDGMPIRTQSKIRRLLRDSNNQFKNAIKYKNIPCLYFIFDDTIFTDDTGLLVAAGLYGNLKLKYPLERNKPTPLFFFR
jgi:hypothetical protein